MALGLGRALGRSEMLVWIIDSGGIPGLPGAVLRDVELRLGIACLFLLWGSSLSRGQRGSELEGTLIQPSHLIDEETEATGRMRFLQSHKQYSDPGSRPF